MSSTKYVYTAMMLILAASCSGCGKKGGGAPPDMVIPVVGYKAAVQPVAEKIFLVGTLEANEVVEIKSEIDGTIEQILFEEGQKVKKGDILIKIDQRKLLASLAQAQANLNLAETTSKRYEALIESRAISGQEHEKATADLDINKAAVELTKAKLRDSVIQAPFDGIMGERKVSAGQFITMGASLGFLISQDPIKANFRVPERYLSKVKEKQTVEMAVSAYPDETFKGEVFFVDPKIEELTRTALMKARIPNGDGKLRHGMFANLQLTVTQKENAVVIPESALILKGDNAEVYTVNADTTVAVKPVKTGIRLPGFVEITEGLPAGDVVVVEGYQKLFPGAKAKVRFEEATETKEAAAEAPKTKTAETPKEK